MNLNHLQLWIGDLFLMMVLNSFLASLRGAHWLVLLGCCFFKAIKYSSYRFVVVDPNKIPL